MFDVIQDIQPLADFNGDAGHFIEKMKRTGRPMVLTANGEAEAVVLAPAAYRELLDAVLGTEDEEMDAFLRESIAEADAGKLIPASQVFAELEASKP